MINPFYNLIWVILIIISSGFLFSSKHFAFLDKKINYNRESNIDGIRFLLASFVAMHHFIFSYNYFSGKGWSISKHNIFNDYLGVFSVCVFFLISGYLFVSCCNNNNIKWKSFYIKRFTRIFPMITFQSLVCIAILLILTKQSINQIIDTDNIYSIFDWLNGGISSLRPDLFGIHQSWVTMGGVIWTLQWEWMLYFSLPFICVLMGKTNKYNILLASLFLFFYVFQNYSYSSKSFISLFVSIFTISFLLPFLMSLFNIKKYNTVTLTLIILLILSSYFSHYIYKDSVICASFIVGALCNQYKSFFRHLISKTPSFLLNILLIISFLISFAIFHKKSYLSFSFVFSCSVFFVILLSGANLFNFLNLKGVIRLGNASFSLYLLHSIGWFIINKTLLHFNILHISYVFYFCSTLMWFFICYLSLLTFNKIEIPWIGYGQTLGKSL